MYSNNIVNISLNHSLFPLSLGKEDNLSGPLWLVHCDPVIISTCHGFLRRSLVFRVSLILMFSYCRHPRFRYFGSVVPFMLFGFCHQAIRNNLGEKHIHSSRRQRLPYLLQKVTKTRNPTPERETVEFKSTAVLPYIKGVFEPLRRRLQQQRMRTVFKSDTRLKSRLVRPKDPADPNKQGSVVYKIPCKCGKIYVGENRTTHARKNERTLQG